MAIAKLTAATALFLEEFLPQAIEHPLFAIFPEPEPEPLRADFSQVSCAEAIRALQPPGFERARQRGSHAVMRWGAVGCVTRMHAALTNRRQ